MVTIPVILLILAVVCFFLDSIRVQAPVSFFPLGWMFVALAWVVSGFAMR